ncbi:E3 ubiquitin/ISG15 ligase TRIM25-like [Polypterus senegalus]|uniref:E3 ubiquitin/ISG15 ligase TRIM25-like n=1 Tax=Polypterus senegalus TaxID=55291 RepID=UPI001964E83C|nr:E3 ubiquitin/ISG15 ligase TRIM25-like [Polypterus senegalus]
MAEATISLSPDQFTCPMCLEILKDPVSIPCGHNYCMLCIKDYWDQAVEYSCPQCREVFHSRPVLRRNTMLVEVVEKVKISDTSVAPSQCYAGPGDVECDFCIGRKFRAVKSCLTCLASFCETHVQPHYEGAIWKDHRLVTPTAGLPQNLCTKHGKAMEVFCKTDEVCICCLCVATEHRSHETVTSEAGRAEKQAQMGAALAVIQAIIQKRQKKLKELKQSVNLLKRYTDCEVQECERMFGDLILTIEETSKKVTELIRNQERSEMERAEGAMKRLEREIEDLKKRDLRLRELSKTEDNIYFLQTFQSLCVSSGDGDFLDFTVSMTSKDELQKELTELKQQLEGISKWQLMKVTRAASESPVFIFTPRESRNRQDFLKYACQLTLDSNTAHQNLCLSEDGRTATVIEEPESCLYHPDRFETCWQVLCNEALFHTCSYWEVQWSGGAVEIGVAYKTISRTGEDNNCSLGSNPLSWSLQSSFLSLSGYYAHHNNKNVKISAPHCPRIGVYLDWSGGTLSFYSISKTMTLLHRFQTTFTEPLYPAFRLYTLNSSVTICPVLTVDSQALHTTL